MFSINAYPAKTKDSGCMSAVVHPALPLHAHPVTAALLSLLLLAPFFGGLISCLRDERSSCSMKCCTGKKHCCCCTQQAETQLPGIRNAAVRCPEGCFCRPVLPRPPHSAFFTARIPGLSVGQTDRLRPFSHVIENGRDLAFALLGRPPPSC